MKGAPLLQATERKRSQKNAASTAEANLPKQTATQQVRVKKKEDETKAKKYLNVRSCFHFFL